METEIVAIIYRNEFEKYYHNFKENKSETDLIFCFILLQIYIECLLHQNMRKVIELEFMPPRNSIYINWIKKERRFIPQKIDDFPTLFFSPVPANIQEMIKFIKNDFNEISTIRNLFAHGHQITSTYYTTGKNLSKARKLLTKSQLEISIKNINQIGITWNKLLDEIIIKCKSLNTISDFKFLKIQ